MNIHCVDTRRLVRSLLFICTRRELLVGRLLEARPLEADVHTGGVQQAVDGAANGRALEELVELLVGG